MRVYASQSTGWFGQVVQRSDDGGRPWRPVGNEFAYDGTTGTHQWYDGTPHPWEFARVWHLEPSLTDPDTVYAGAEDAALFKSTDGGRDVDRTVRAPHPPSGPTWQPGAGGMCVHTILVDPTDPDRIHVAISAAGRLPQRRRRGDVAADEPRPALEGHPRPRCRGRSLRTPDRAAPTRPDVLFMQKHWDVMRSDDGGDSWREISGNLPSDFGFPIAVHAHEPDTVYVVPITSDSEHYPPEGQLACLPQPRRGRRLGAAHPRAPATRLLRERPARRDGGRHPRSVRRLLRHDRWAGLRVTRRRRQLGAIVRDLPRVLSVEVQALP